MFFTPSKKNDVILDKLHNKVIIILKGKKIEFDIKTANIMFIITNINKNACMQFTCYKEDDIQNQVKLFFKNKQDIARIRQLEKDFNLYKQYLIMEDNENENKKKEKSFQKLIENTLVSITHPNGEIEQVPDNLILDMDNYVLISEGGNTYHKCTGCFKNWSSIYRENFNGWKLIPIEEAKQQGLTLCNFCKDAVNLDLDKILKLEDTEEDFEEE